MRLVVRYLLPLLVVALLCLRFVGESTFPLQPENLPNKAQVPQTALKTIGDRVLANTSNTEKAANFFYPLGNARLALAARMEIADAASKSIDLQYYLFHDDDSGRALLNAAMLAAQRGVKVRILLDDMDTLGRDGHLARLAAEHELLDIRIFNPALLRSLRAPEYLARFPRVTRRMHNKSFTADNAISVVGGRNVGNEYFDVNTETAFDDLDVVAGGTIAVDVAQAFNVYWHSGLAVDIARLGNPVDDSTYNEYLGNLRRAGDSFKSALQSEDTTAYRAIVKATRTPYFGKGKVIHDPPEKVVSPLFDSSGNLANDISALMSGAQQELLISSPYFIPGDAGMAVFRELRQRGVQVTILTNSLAANDVAAVHAGYIDYRKQLLQIGVELFELKPSTDHRNLSLLGASRASLHAKSFVVDQHRVYVGSFNMDPRSAIHNTEMGVVFESQAYGEEIHRKIKTYLKSMAWQLSLDAADKLSWIDHAGGTKKVLHEEPQTNAFTRALIYAMSWLPVEWLL